MNTTKSLTCRVRFALGAVLFATLAGLALLTGCVGYVGPGGGPDVGIYGPDVAVFGGGGYHGHYDHDASHWGAQSRASAGFHGGGGHHR